MNAPYIKYPPAAVQLVDDMGKLVQSPFAGSSYQAHRLGECMVYRGTTYYYAQAGANSIGIAVGCTSAGPTAHHIDKAVSATVAIGGIVVTPTMGATATAINEYADGILWVNDATGAGQMRRIISNTAAGSSGTPSFTLADPITTALTVSISEVSVMRHPYKDVVIAATTPVADVVGVTTCALTGTYFGWLATYGPGACLVDDSDVIVAGTVVSIPAATAATPGACGVAAVTEPIIGTVIAVNTGLEYAMLMLRIRQWSPFGV